MVIYYLFSDGFLCANKFIVPFDYQNMMGKNYSFVIEPKHFLSLFPDLLLSKNKQYVVFFEFDDCKAGESFNGEICEPCPRNSYLNEKVPGSLALCRQCGENLKYYCYGSNLISQNWIADIKSGRFGSNCENFLKKNYFKKKAFFSKRIVSKCFQKLD